MANTSDALTISGLSKTFGREKALDNVGFSVKPGSVHGLIGGNGSGKSTLIKILAGVHRGDPGGSVTFSGTQAESDQINPELARRLGMRFVHQNPAMFPSMTVAENVGLGAGFPTTAGRIRWQALRHHTQQLLDRYEIAARADDLVGNLRQAEQTMIAIARALQDADEGATCVLVLDEPTASLPDHEVRILLDAIRRLSRMGHTVIYVSHRLEEILDITDHVTVLRDGRHIETRPTQGLQEADLIRMIVGRSVDRTYAQVSALPRSGDQRQTPVLEVQGLGGGPLADVSFSLQSGEVLGIAGLLGSGRTELLKMIFGDMAHERGAIRLDGKKIAFSEPLQAMQAGIAMVPENREREGVFQGLSVMENMTVGQFHKFTTGGVINRRREQLEACKSVVEYRVKTRNERAQISSLSGGNQQKVVMARWLRRAPRLLLLDEPTQGVDVGAREDIYAAIRSSLANGMGVLVASSDFDELAQLCQRVIILKQGRITGELVGEDLTRHTMTEQVLISEGGNAA